MTTACPRKWCHAPEVPCLDGYVELAQCPAWPRGDADQVPAQDGHVLPWSGLAMGHVDLEAVAAASRTRLVAIIGLPKAGKTTALAAWFVLLRRGRHPAGNSFAGSYSMMGWNSVSRHFDWPPEGHRGFPPHTTSASRTPALLHLALSNGEGNIRDVLFTDVPGEWFREWSYDPKSSPGSCWIADEADVFVLMSDADALAGKDRGKARSEYTNLANRVASVADDRPVIPVRTKADIAVPDGIDDALARVDERLFGQTAIPMSVLDTDGQAPLLESIEKIIATALAPITIPRGKDENLPRDLMLGFRAPSTLVGR